MNFSVLPLWINGKYRVLVQLRGTEYSMQIEDAEKLARNILDCIQKMNMPEKCSQCGGTGKCSACGGSGWENPIDFRICLHCNNSGKCQLCAGSGYELNKYFGLSESLSEKKITSDIFSTAEDLETEAQRAEFFKRVEKSRPLRQHIIQTNFKCITCGSKLKIVGHDVICPKCDKPLLKEGK
jgi:DNA-directed RNA polymerase subunit RPC12/RpoP/RecJ-like exonuclease